MNTKEVRSIRTINRSRKAKKIIIMLAVMSAAAVFATVGASALSPFAPVVADTFTTNAKSKLVKIITMVGGGVGVWGVVNLLEGYGSDNPGAKSQGIKQVMAGAGLILASTLVNNITWG